MTHTAGSRLGPYEILDAIGAGGMGEVYRAKDTRLERWRRDGRDLYFLSVATLLAGSRPGVAPRTRRLYPYFL